MRNLATTLIVLASLSSTKSFVIKSPSRSSKISRSLTTDELVFGVGLAPFAIATVEFWRRIAVNEPFGTKEPVYFIGDDDNRASSRGKQVLGQDSMLTAYAIFAIVIAVLGLTAASILTSPPVPMDL